MTITHTSRARPAFATLHRRRGTGIAAVVLLIAVINIAAVSVIRSGGDESESALLRAQSLQAYYAAESGAIVVVKLSKSSQTLPSLGSSLSIGNAVASYNAVPGSGGGTLEVSGSAGEAVRDVRVVYQVQ